MRIKNNIENLNYEETQSFFQNRAEKYNTLYPYSVTMYQDSHPELTAQRNEHEVKKLKVFLNFNKNSRVLDLACGIGRWADQIDGDIDYYHGVDFASNLINIARERTTDSKKKFTTGLITNIQNIIPDKTFNRVLIIGALMYLNDADLSKLFDQLNLICEKHSIICIREPIALEERLTLKQFYSNELKSDYNAIYRTKSELVSFLQKTLLEKGFFITHEGFLFDDNQDLNNRKETSQYFFILEN